MIFSIPVINRKLVHILLVIAISFIVLTSVLNTTLLSKENIIEMLAYSTFVTEVEIAPADSIFFARVIRQQLWLVHFYAGVAAIVLSMDMLQMISDITIKSKKISLILNEIVLLFLFISGFALYFRKEMLFNTSTITMLRDFHWAGVYLSIIIIIYHLFSYSLAKAKK